MKKYSHKMNRPTMQGIVECIELMVAQKAETDDDRLLFSALLSARKVIKKKLLDKEAEYSNSKKYSLSFLPTDAIALRILYTDYVQNTSNYIGAQLLMISNEVHQQFFTT